MFASQIILKINKSFLKKLLDTRFLSVSKQLNQNDEDILKCYSEDESFNVNNYLPLREEDYVRFISRRASKREPALTRQITSLAYKVGKEMISLAEGMPNEEVFPFSKLRLETKGGREIILQGNELKTALQYVPSQGLPSLITALHKFQQSVHRPPPLARDVLATSGAQHGIYACVELLAERGDPVLVSQYTYGGIHSALKPYQPEILSIPEDKDGLIPESLHSLLEDRLNRSLRMPKFLYLVPTGNNPTGSVIPAERRRKIYELACAYDFLIIEDDPYVFLNYTEKTLPSFLSMDTCGRVIRLDSVSKVVSSGLRGGWMTAPAALVKQAELHLQAEVLHACTLSQAILQNIISDPLSLASHLRSVRSFYRCRRDALNTALGGVADLAEWTLPDAGLFFWVRVRGVHDIYNMVHLAFERGVMLVPGQAFMYDSRAPCQHLRLTFSKIPFENMELAVRHLAAIIKDFQQEGLQKQQQFATHS